MLLQLSYFCSFCRKPAPPLLIFSSSSEPTQGYHISSFLPCLHHFCGHDLKEIDLAPLPNSHLLLCSLHSKTILPSSSHSHPSLYQFGPHFYCFIKTAWVKVTSNLHTVKYKGQFSVLNFVICQWHLTVDLSLL